MIAGKLKIAIWHNLPSGGGKRAMHDQVRGLVARGHHVESWCPPTADQAFLPIGGIVDEHVVPHEYTPRRRRGLLGSRTQAYGDLLDRMEAMDRHCRLCAEEINRGRFDVLLAHPCRYFRVTPLARYATIPRLIYLQEPDRELYEATPRLPWVAPPPQSSGVPWPKRLNRFAWDLIALQNVRVRARQERENIGAYDQVLVNSCFSRESLLRAYGLDSKVCYLGVDTDVFRPSDAPKGRYVVGLGNIYGNKRVDLAIRAIGSIEASHRPELVWIGNASGDAYHREVEELARSLGVVFQPQVHIPDVELVDLVGRAAAMIYTSYLEPFGYAPLEAGSCGTAVVAVAEGGVRESIRDGVNGDLIGDANPVALGSALRRYCDDLDLAREAGMRARRHVIEQWGIEVSIDRLERRLIDFLGRDVSAQPAAAGARSPLSSVA